MALNSTDWYFLSIHWQLLTYSKGFASLHSVCLNVYIDVPTTHWCAVGIHKWLFLPLGLTFCFTSSVITLWLKHKWKQGISTCLRCEQHDTPVCFMSSYMNVTFAFILSWKLATYCKMLENSHNPTDMFTNLWHYNIFMNTSHEISLLSKFVPHKYSLVPSLVSFCCTQFSANQHRIEIYRPAYNKITAWKLNNEIMTNSHIPAQQG